MKNLEYKNLEMLGYTTDYNKCDCCGKENLKGTINILDKQNDVILHFGTTCAVKADKYDDLNTLQLIKKETNKAIRKYNDNYNFAGLTAWRLGIDTKNTTVIQDYIKFKSFPENNVKRFNWENYK